MPEKNVEYPAGTPWKCKRPNCLHEWMSRKDGKPIACAGCKSAYWERPEQVKKHASRGVGATAQ